MNKHRIKKIITRLANLPNCYSILKYLWNKVCRYYFRATKSTRVAYPSSVMLELSAHCNLHCTTCPREYAYGKNMDKGYMTVENAKKIIDEIWLYLDFIGLTGLGETLLYNDTEEIVDYIQSKNKDIVISLSTNAVVPDFMQRVTPLVGKIGTIQISIDGLHEVYELIRRNAQFATLDTNLRSLRQLFPESNTVFMFNMVVTEENYEQMADVVSYAEEIGIQYVNFTLYNLASTTDVPSDYYDLYKTEKFLLALKQLEERKTLVKNVKVTHWNYETKNEFQKCSFPWSNFSICWNGELPPCCAKPFPKELSFGNCLKDGVMPVLNGNEFRQFRKMWLENKTPDFCKKCHFIDIEPIKTIQL